MVAVREADGSAGVHVRRTRLVEVAEPPEDRPEPAACDSAGSHTLNAHFLTAEFSVPAPAQILNCLLRCGLWLDETAVSWSRTSPR